MDNTMKKVAATSGSVLLLASMGAGALAASENAYAVDATPQESQAVEAANAGQQSVARVEGTFSFTQQSITPTEAIAQIMQKAEAYLCGSLGSVGATTELNEGDWSLRVTGAAETPFMISGEELGDEATQSLVLGCSCAGNPAGGAATVNAEVTGVSVVHLMEMAGVDPAANTAVFTSADGYKVELPVIYLKTHYCPIVFDVNGEPLGERIGGVNQLWLGSTSAKYFARDITSITFEVRDEAPEAPDSQAARGSYANLPNIGVFFGGDVE